MNSYKNLNNILGWLSFLVAMIVYGLTVEPSVSLWDCGEFISASYKLQVVHPPGAPFFLMIGRMFSLLASSPEDVAWAVNMLSVTTSALTVMFTFWITTYFGRKMISKNETPNGGNMLIILGAGIVAALTLTFSDTFWFSAVEAEVYALSSCFTALTFWLMLKWEGNADKPGADRYIVFVFFMIGLALGAHLLNLLVIPAMAFIFYFKKYKETSRKGLIYTFLGGLGVLFFIQKGIIPGIVYLIAHTDKLFVNDFGLPFWSGAIFIILLIIGLLVWGIKYSIKKKSYYGNLAMLCLTFVIVGYSSYAMVVIRSSANPAIDMNDPEDPFNLLSYINREQYGDRPLTYGPHWSAQPISSEKVKTIYKMGKDSDGEDYYVEAGEKYEYVYDDKDKAFFPRMGDANKDNGGRGYRYWGGMGKVQDRLNQIESQITNAKTPQAKQELQIQKQKLETKKPSFGNNIRYFVSYQLNYMWFRYFMWNFSGRQNETQGHSYNRYQSGNWLSGIGIVDNLRLGNQSKIASEAADNKGRNKYYMLPFLLGIIGMVFHYKRKKEHFIVTLMLFLFTGILLMVFLNQPPFEPRERDYASVGSFQTFCIWVGLGIIGLASFIKKYVDGKIAGILAIVVGLFAAPILMASENWDDHDRSDRYLGIDFANNYLESCAPNAILFCNGDNDTYPLWYAQNVEGKRTDVRIINMALLPTDWYSGALLRDVYDSKALPLTVTLDQLRSDRTDIIRYADNKITNQNVYMPLDKVIKFVLSTESNTYFQGTQTKYLPTKKFKIAVDKAAIKKNKVVMEKDMGSVVDEILLNYPRTYMSKGDIVLFDFLAQNAKQGWERPIYFTSTTGSSSFVNLQAYFQQEGLVHRFVPIKSPLQGSYPTKLADDILYDNIMNDYKWCGVKEKENFLLDDKASLVPQTQRELMYRLAMTYVSEAKNKQAQNEQFAQVGSPDGKMTAETVEANKKVIEANNSKAKNLIQKSLVEMPLNKIPMRAQLVAYYINVTTNLGMKEETKALQDYLIKNATEYVTWISSMKKKDQTDFLKQEVGSYLNSLNTAVQVATQEKQDNAADLKKTLDELNTKFNQNVSQY